MKTSKFKLENQDFIPLNQLLKLENLVGTGGEANIRITYGEVQVNGQVEFQKRKKIRSGDVVQLGQHQINVI